MSVRLYCNYVTATDSILVPSIHENVTARQPVLALGLVGGLHKVQSLGPRSRSHESVIEPTLSFDALASTRGTTYAPTVPSPRLDMDLGDEAVITLMPSEDAEIGVDLKSFKVFRGIHPVRLGDPRELTGTAFPPGSASFLFRPEAPGTYLYKLEAAGGCGISAYGTIVVYPSYVSLADNGLRKRPLLGWRSAGSHQIPFRATNRSFGSSHAWSFFDSEWILLMFDSCRLTPTGGREVVSLVNGRSFPDTLLPAQLPPLGETTACSLPSGYHTRISVALGDRFLLRVVNASSSTIPFGLQGQTPLVVARNGEPGYREGFWTDSELLQIDQDVPPEPINLRPNEGCDLLYTARVDRAMLDECRRSREMGVFSLENAYLGALSALGGPVRELPQELLSPMADMMANSSSIPPVRVNPFRRFFGLGDILMASQESLPTLKFAGSRECLNEIAPQPATGMPLAVVETTVPASSLGLLETAEDTSGRRGFRRRRLMAGRKRRRPLLTFKLPRLRWPLLMGHEPDGMSQCPSGVANSFVIVHTKGGLLGRRKKCVARVLERELRKLRCGGGPRGAPTKGLYVIFTESLKVNGKDHKRFGRRRWVGRSAADS